MKNGCVPKPRAASSTTYNQRQKIRKKSTQKKGSFVPEHGTCDTEVRPAQTAGSANLPGITTIPQVMQ
jgi:hypothetical protein